MTRASSVSRRRRRSQERSRLFTIRNGFKESCWPSLDDLPMWSRLGFWAFPVLDQIGRWLGLPFSMYEPQRDCLIAVKAFRLDLVPAGRRAPGRRAAPPGSGANLAHPSLVLVVDAGSEGTMAFLGMDYIAGEDPPCCLPYLAQVPLDRALPVPRRPPTCLRRVGRPSGHGGYIRATSFWMAATPTTRASTGVGIRARARIRQASRHPCGVRTRRRSARPARPGHSR